MLTQSQLLPQPPNKNKTKQQKTSLNRRRKFWPQIPGAVKRVRRPTTFYNTVIEAGRFERDLMLNVVLTSTLYVIDSRYENIRKLSREACFAHNVDN